MRISFPRTDDASRDRTPGAPGDAPAVADQTIRAGGIVMASSVCYDDTGRQLLAPTDRISEREEKLTLKEFRFILAPGDPDRTAMECVQSGYRNFPRSTSRPKQRGAFCTTGVPSKGDTADKPVMGRPAERAPP